MSVAQSLARQWEYLGNLVHRVVECDTATGAGVRQASLLLQILYCRHTLVMLAPRALAVPGPPQPTPTKLLMCVHLHLPIVHAVDTIWQILGVMGAASIWVCVSVDEGRADIDVDIGIKVLLTIGW